MKRHLRLGKVPNKSHTDLHLPPHHRDNPVLLALPSELILPNIMLPSSSCARTLLVLKLLDTRASRSLGDCPCYLFGEIGQGKEFNKIINFIKTHQPIDDLEHLAYYRDNHGCSVTNNAMREIRAALQKRILFMGRFQFVNGPPLHTSATSVVLLKAFDKEIVYKFKVQFNKVLKEQFNASNAASVHKKCLQRVLKRLGFGADNKRFNNCFPQSDANKNGQISRYAFLLLCNAVINNNNQGGVLRR
jgi:hypothetical protein